MARLCLSPAERAVTDLLLRGMSNKAIADELVLSVRTIESHVSHALLKTGCRNRLELAMWLLGHQVGDVIEPAGTVPELPA